MKYIFLWLCLFLSIPTYASDEALPPSLFFSPQEVQSIMETLSKTAPDNAGIYQLGAILYYSPQDWTFWLGNQRWTPETTHPDIRVINVEPATVHLLWLGNDSEDAQKVALHPHQTYNVLTHTIGEDTHE